MKRARIYARAIYGGANCGFSKTSIRKTLLRMINARLYIYIIHVYSERGRDIFFFSFFIYSRIDRILHRARVYEIIQSQTTTKKKQLQKLNKSKNKRFLHSIYYSTGHHRDSNFGIDPNSAAVCGYRVPSSPQREVDTAGHS